MVIFGVKTFRKGLQSRVGFTYRLSRQLPRAPLFRERLEFSKLFLKLKISKNKNNHKQIEPSILKLKEFKIDSQGEFNIFGISNHIKW